jgi:hypothetical protein
MSIIFDTQYIIENLFMIKRIQILAITVIAIAVLSGCSKTQPNLQESGDSHCMQDGILAPKWTCSPQSYDTESILSLGTRPLSKAGESFAINNAIAEAHNNLAFLIQTQVKAKVEHFVRDRNISNKKVVEHIETQVFKQLANAILNDSKQLEFWQTPRSVYILIGISNDVINTKVKKEILSSSPNNLDALWRQSQSKELLDSLNKEFPTK